MIHMDEKQLLLLAGIVLENKYYFMSESHAYLLKDSTVNNITDDAFTPQGPSVWQMLCTLLAEKRIVLNKRFNVKIGGKTYYQVLEGTSLYANEGNAITPKPFTEKELRLLLAFTGEGPRYTYCKGGWAIPSENLEAYFAAEEAGEDTAPYRTKYIPPHERAEYGSPHYVLNEQEPEKSGIEWFVGDWGTEIAGHDEENAMLQDFIKRGLVTLGEPHDYHHLKSQNIQVFGHNPT